MSMMGEETIVNRQGIMRHHSTFCSEPYLVDQTWGIGLHSGLKQGTEGVDRRSTMAFIILIIIFLE